MMNKHNKTKLKPIKLALMVGAASLAMVAVQPITATPVHAQKGVVLQPLTGWSVKNVKNADSTSSYCAVARRFRNDLILSVAQNHNDESSIALDFSNEAFDLDQSFPIMLDAGAGEIRQFDVYPVSRKAFVVRLGNDASFFNALNRTGHMRVEVRGRNYNFNLADIERGRSQLAKCLADNARFARQEPVSKSTFKAEETQAFHELSRRLEMLEQENRSLQTELDDVQDNFVSATGQPAPPIPLGILPEREIGALDIATPPGNILDRGEFQGREREHERSLNKLLSAKPGNVAGIQADRIQDKVVASARDARNETLTQRERDMLYPNAERVKNLKTLEYLRDENEKLRKALQENPHASAELQAMNEMADTISHENLQLTTQLADMHALKAEHLSQIEALTEGNSALELSLEEAGKHQLKITEQIDVLEKKVLTLETDNARYREAIDMTKANLQATLEQRDDWKSKYTSLEEASRTRIEKLQLDLSSKQKEAGELQSLMSGGAELNQNLSDEIQRLRQENADMQARIQAELAATEAVREEVVTLSHRIGEMRSENQNLQDQVRAFQDQNQKQKEEFLSRLESENQKLAENLKTQQQFQSNIKKMEAEIAFLKGDNDALKTQYEAKLVTEGQKLNSHLQEQTQLKERISELRARIEGLLKEQEAMRVSYESQLSGERQKLVDAGKEKDSLQMNIAALEGRIATLESDKTSLKTAHTDDAQKRSAMLDLERQKLERETQKLSQVSSEKKLLEGRVAKLQGQVEALQAKNVELVSDYSDKIKERDASLVQAQENKKVLELKIASLNQDIQNLSTEKMVMRDSHSSRLFSEETEKKNLEAQISDLQNEISTLESNHKNVVAQKDATIETSAVKISSLEEQISAMRFEVSTLEANVRTLESELTFAQKKSGELQALLDNKQGALASEKTRLIENLKAQELAQSRISDLEKKLSSLEFEKERQEESYQQQIAMLEKARASALEETGSVENNIAVLKQEVLALERENATLEATAKANEGRYVKDIARLESQWNSGKIDRDQYETRVIEMTQQLEALRAENAQVSQNWKTAQADAEKLERLLNEKRDDLAAEKQKYLSNIQSSQNYEDEIKALNKRIASLESDKDSAYKTLSRELEQQKSRLSSEQAEKQELEMKVGALNSDLKKLEAQNIATQRDLKIAQVQLEDKRSSKDSRLSQVEMLLKEKDLEIARLKDAKSHIQNEKDAAITAMESERSTEFVKLSQSNQDAIAAMKRDYEARMAALRDQLDASNTATLDANSDREREMAAMLRRQQERLNAMQSERDVLTRQLEEQNIMLDRVREDYNRERDQRSQIREAFAQVPATSNVVSETPKKSVPKERSERPEREFVDYLSQAPVVSNTASLSAAQRQELEVREKLGEGALADLASSARAQAPNTTQDMPVSRQAREPATPRQVIEPRGDVADRTVERASISQATTQRAGVTQEQQPALARAPQIYAPSVDVGALIRSADISLSDNIERVDRFSGSERVAYQWRSRSNIFGSAQQTPIASRSEFDALVDRYLEDTERRCTGDFAVVPSESFTRSGNRIDSYEIACIGAGVDSSASIVFFAKDDVFTAVAHEGSSEKMGSAMDLRDKVVSAVERRS